MKRPSPHPSFVAACFTAVLACLPSGLGRPTLLWPLSHPFTDPPGRKPSLSATCRRRKNSRKKGDRDDRHPLSVQRARNILGWLDDPDLLKRWQKIFVPHRQTDLLQAMTRSTKPFFGMLRSLPRRLPSERCVAQPTVIQPRGRKGRYRPAGPGRPAARSGSEPPRL